MWKIHSPFTRILCVSESSWCVVEPLFLTRTITRSGGALCAAVEICRGAAVISTAPRVLREFPSCSGHTLFRHAARGAHLLFLSPRVPFPREYGAARWRADFKLARQRSGHPSTAFARRLTARDTCIQVACERHACRAFFHRINSMRCTAADARRCQGCDLRPALLITDRL